MSRAMTCGRSYRGNLGLIDEDRLDAAVRSLGERASASHLQGDIAFKLELEDVIISSKTKVIYNVRGRRR